MFDARSPLIPDLIDLHGKWRGAKAAIEAPEGTVSWAEFASSARRVAHGLDGLGVGVGDRVGVLMGNRLATVEALFGILAAGGVAVPLNLSVGDAAALGMLNDAGVRAIVATRDQVDRLDAVRKRIETLIPGALICASDATDTPATGWIDFARWKAGEPDRAVVRSIPPGNPCNIIYSSGTTGLPKGIVHTHERRRDWATDLALALRYHGGARTLATLGLYSNISWVAMLCTFVVGGTLVLHHGFDARRALLAIAERRVTHMSMVPVQLQRMLELPDVASFETDTMQSIMCCGSPLPVAHKERLFELFRCGVIELYGLTEGVITTLDPEDAKGRMASVGKPLLGTDIRLVGEDDREVAPGEAGEIVACGRIVMPGYWNRDDASEQATWRDGEGRAWLRTGDVGRLDQDGFLTIVDRKKDMILCGGQNIYPADIEAVLLTHDDVGECAVIGVPSEKWGETPLAIVVARAGMNPSIETIRDWLNARVGKQQRVAAVEIRDALPRNPNGKILKRELRQPYWPDR